MKRPFILFLVSCFIITSLYIPSSYAADGLIVPIMPAPGIRVNLSQPFMPSILRGITIHPDNALQFDFLVHKGDEVLGYGQKQEEYKKLVKYFLASLTIPEKDQWVNLSPYEHDRIIADDFGKTEMGHDLLAQDYFLKQITSSLMYPETGLGKKFWDKVYERAWKEYGTTTVPVNTFNKVWIVPDQAIVYESGNTAYILKSHLKVMLEEDYLSMAKHNIVKRPNSFDVKKFVSLRETSEASDEAISKRTTDDTHTLGSQIIKAIILPELEKEINEGKNFALLRQVYSGMILATWYKKALKESLLGQVYVNKAKTGGVDHDPKTNEEIYRHYLKAFKKGVFNYIKEDEDKYSKQTIPRKYFAGGWDATQASHAIKIVDRATLVSALKNGVSIDTNPAMIGADEVVVVNLDEKRDSDPAMMTRRLLLQTAAAYTLADRLNARQQAPATAVEQEKEIPKKEESPTVLKIRALNGDKEALKEIISRAKEELPFAKALFDLRAYGLTEAEDALKNMDYFYYLRKAEAGDLGAFSFLSLVSYDNRQLTYLIRNMDVAIFVRRAQAIPERGEEKGWKKRREDYLMWLRNLAEFFNNLGAMVALRNMESAEGDDQKIFVSFGNLTAINKLAAQFDSQRMTVDKGPFDVKVLSGDMDMEKMDAIDSAILYHTIDNQQAHLLREYDFCSLFKLVMAGNTKVIDFIFDSLIGDLGHQKVAVAARDADIKDLIERVKKGETAAYWTLLKFYKLGNAQAVQYVRDADIAAFVAKAQEGDLDALDVLIDLDSYQHLQVPGELQNLKIDDILKHFRPDENDFRVAVNLYKLAVNFDNQAAYGAFVGNYALDFSKIKYGYTEDDRLAFFIKVAETGSLTMISFLKNEYIVKISDEDFVHPNTLYKLAVIYDNQSAIKYILSSLMDSWHFKEEIASGSFYGAEMLLARQKLRRKIQIKIKDDIDGLNIEDLIRQGEEEIKKKKDQEANDKAMGHAQLKQSDFLKGGIDLNSANLNLQIIKRDGQGIPLPLVQQDMAQLSRIQGFEPRIIKIKSLTTPLPIQSEIESALSK